MCFDMKNSQQLAGWVQFCRALGTRVRMYIYNIFLLLRYLSFCQIAEMARSKLLQHPRYMQNTTDHNSRVAPKSVMLTRVLYL